MAYSESLAQQVRTILATELPPRVFEEEVEEKKVFGGLAFMVRGKTVPFVLRHLNQYSHDKACLSSL